MQVDVVNKSGEPVSKLELNDAVFNCDMNMDLVYRAVTFEQANKRPGTAFFKNRELISLTGKKMFKQKGTGNARHGAASSNIFVGGGAAFGAQRNSFKKDLPKKMKKKALCCLLSQKVKEKKFHVIDKMDVASGKTKDLVTQIKGVVNLKKNFLLINDPANTMVKRSAANIDKLVYIDYAQLNALSLYVSNDVVVDKTTAEKLNAMRV